MPSRLPIVVRIAALSAVGAFGTARLAAQLTANSPFLPPPSAANASSATQNAALEFRAVMQTEKGVEYRLYDPAKKLGVWAKVNERNPEFGATVKQYDPNREMLTLEHEGRTLNLELRKAKIVSSGSVAQVMPTPMPMPAPANAVAAQPAQPNPTPAEEQKRLEAVAAEVARRRALREQGSPPTPVNAAPQVVAPVQLPQQNINTLPARGRATTTPANRQQK